jgi:hypothetical protein
MEMIALAFCEFSSFFEELRGFSKGEGGRNLKEEATLSWQIQV